VGALFGRIDGSEALVTPEAIRRRAFGWFFLGDGTAVDALRHLPSVGTEPTAIALAAVALVQAVLAKGAAGPTLAAGVLVPLVGDAQTSAAAFGAVAGTLAVGTEGDAPDTAEAERVEAVGAALGGRGVGADERVHVIRCILYRIYMVLFCFHGKKRVERFVYSNP
jgi:hypothetical protein